MFYETLFQPLSYLIFIMILETWQGRNFPSPPHSALFQTRNRIREMMWLKGRVTLESECLYAGAHGGHSHQKHWLWKEESWRGNRSQPPGEWCWALPLCLLTLPPLLGPLSLFASWAPTHPTKPHLHITLDKNSWVLVGRLIV